jgi:hypothetical protein
MYCLPNARLLSCLNKYIQNVFILCEIWVINFFVLYHGNCKHNHFLWASISFGEEGDLDRGLSSIMFSFFHTMFWKIFQVTLGVFTLVVTTELGLP